MVKGLRLKPQNQVVLLFGLPKTFKTSYVSKTVNKVNQVLVIYTTSNTSDTDCLSLGKYVLDYNSIAWVQCSIGCTNNGGLNVCHQLKSVSCKCTLILDSDQHIC